MSGSINCGTFTQWNTMQQKERRAPTLCNSTDGTGEHYAKWDQPVVKDKYHMTSPLTGT